MRRHAAARLVTLVLACILFLLCGPSAAAPAPPAKSAGTNDPVALELQRIMADDDEAQEQVNKWIAAAQNAEGPTALSTRAALRLKIDQRLAGVRARYQDFLQLNPRHARGHLAFGSFLYEQGEEADGVKQWERALELDPKNPAAWNNLANHYGHRGPVKKAFEYYARAIELDPKQSQYYHSLGTVVFLFRKDAMEHFHLDEQQVFDKALALYAKAMELDPEDFTLAADVAQTYYGIKPPRNDAAIAAWERAIKLAPDDVDRQGVHVHLARIEINMGRFDEARAHLTNVTHALYTDVKIRVLHNLDEKEKKSRVTTPPSSGVIPK